MSGYTFSRAEQETTVVWDEEEKIAHIYTASPVTMRKLDALCANFPDVYVCVWVDAQGRAKKYTAPANRIRFAKPTSEAQREAGRKSGFSPRTQGNSPVSETSTAEDE